jgi:hypothetical protein
VLCKIILENKKAQAVFVLIQVFASAFASSAKVIIDLSIQIKSSIIKSLGWTDCII